MSWIDTALGAVKAQLTSVFPALGAMDAAREFISETVAQRIREEACAKAYELMAQAHRDVVKTIIWQNALLALSILPVYLFKSAWPFYAAYVVVAGYTAYSLFKHKALVLRLLKTRSILSTLTEEVYLAIEVELTQRQFIQRKAVEWLGPDLRKLAREVATKLKPDVLAATTNMALTLLLAFVAFRLFAIPMLERHALM